MLLFVIIRNKFMLIGNHGTKGKSTQPKDLLRRVG